MPNLITPQQYDKTIGILSGKAALNPVFRELKAWYAQQAEFEIYNFILETGYGPAETAGKNTLLYLSNGLLSGRDGRFSVTRIDGDLSDPAGIVRDLHSAAFVRFSALCESYGQFEGFEWAYRSLGGYDFHPIWQCETVTRFAAEAIPVVQPRYAHAHIHRMLSSGFGAVTVFFERDADLDGNRGNGVCAAIEADFKRLFAHSLENDPLRRLYDGGSIVEFSSEETLNRDFQGNLYYFYK